MSVNSTPLKWSTQLQVAPQSRTPRLVGDKITLPQSALEALLAAAPVVAVQNGNAQPLTSAFDPYNPYTYAAEQHAREQLAERQQLLPHPLTFRIVNAQNGRVVHAGIREFSAEDNEVGLSTFLRDELGLEDGETPEMVASAARDGGDTVMTDLSHPKPLTVSVSVKELPKGTYVRLRPLEAGYDPEDWKSLLERYLRDNFTTLTNGEILTVAGGRNEHFRFLVDKFEPMGDGICIVDTDLEVDIEALNEEQARETLKRKLAKAQRAPGTAEGSSAGGKISVDQLLDGQVVPGEYVDYELSQWDRTRSLEVSLETTVDDAELYLFVSPLSARQRAKPREDEHVFGDFSGRQAKRIKLTPTNVEIEDAESIHISVHSRADKAISKQPSPPTTFTLHCTSGSAETSTSAKTGTSATSADGVICKNCHQTIPKRTLPLHEAFCYRNNVLCPHCSNVFLKQSDTWKQHWHCPNDDAFGNTPISHTKHDSIFHPAKPIPCPRCGDAYGDLPSLARHKTSSCPGKEILCQFCHLVVPQQGPDDPMFTDPEVLLSGLTPHELADGARTTECHLCNKIVRLRDMKTHLRFHDQDRLTRIKPRLCQNSICGRTIKAGDEGRVQKEQLGLCGECFGPLYNSAYDPEGKALRRRIERRLLQQIMKGCEKPWCGNSTLCRSGKKNTTSVDEVVTAKDALIRVKPVMDGLAKGQTAGLIFCVDEASQRRRATAEMLAGELEYELDWCVKGLEESHGELGKARDWLKDRAPRIGEVAN